MQRIRSRSLFLRSTPKVSKNSPTTLPAPKCQKMSSTPSSVTTPLSAWWNNMSLSGIYPSISTSTPSSSSSWSSHFVFGGHHHHTNNNTANTPQSTVPPSALSSGYTEDITVAGSLLKDKINGLVDSLMGRESVHSGCGYGEDGRIAMMVRSLKRGVYYGDTETRSAFE